jgi:hypothetical protein
LRTSSFGAGAVSRLVASESRIAVLRGGAMATDVAIDPRKRSRDRNESRRHRALSASVTAQDTASQQLYASPTGDAVTTSTPPQRSFLGSLKALANHETTHMTVYLAVWYIGNIYCESLLYSQ